MTDLTPFERAAALTQVPAERQGDLHFLGDIPGDWAQGRTAFGGLSAALLIDAVRRLPETSGSSVRSLDVAFIGPVPPGTVSVVARALRRGKYLTHASAELLGTDGVPLTSIHAVFAELRESTVQVRPEPPPMTPVDQCLEMPHLEGITPDFARNFAISFALGIPFTGSDEARINGWCRHRTPATGPAAVAALVDAWPGSVLPVLTAPAPASTVRWSLQFPGSCDIIGDDWFWYESDTVIAAGGYSTMTARLWQGDRLVSWSEQLLAVFERR